MTEETQAPAQPQPAATEAPPSAPADAFEEFKELHLRSGPAIPDQDGGGRLYPDGAFIQPTGGGCWRYGSPGTTEGRICARKTYWQLVLSQCRRDYYAFVTGTISWPGASDWRFPFYGAALDRREMEVRLIQVYLHAHAVIELLGGQQPAPYQGGKTILR
jgi:hypothetical protein